MGANDDGSPRVDFFGIGAPRSATTWLASCLDEHPKIAISRPKETSFFVRRLGLFQPYDNPGYIDDWQWYRQRFVHASKDDVRGDFSVNLLHNSDTAPHAIARHYPDARFVAVLRDPVRRAYSHYWRHFGLQGRWGKLPKTFRAAIEVDGLIDPSRYGRHLARWFDVFGPTRFHVVLDLDLARDRASALRNTYEFLGVDPDYVPPSRDVRVNATRRRLGLYGAAYRLATWLRARGLGRGIDALKDATPIERVIDRADVQRMPAKRMDPEAARILRRRLRPDMEALERLLDRDLTPWKEGTAGNGAPRRDRMTTLEADLRPPAHRVE